MSQLPPFTDPPPPMPGGMRARAPAPAPVPGGRVPGRPDVSGPGRVLATWKAWQVIVIYLAVAFFVASLIIGIMVATLGDGGDVLIAANILVDLVLLGSLYAFLQRRHPAWRESMGWPRRDRLASEGGIGAAMGLGLYVLANFVVGLALYFAIQAISGEPPGQPEQLPQDLTDAGRVLAAVFAVLVAPVTEEFFFRGCLFRALRDRHGFAAGALGSAALFGLVHIPLEGTLMQTLLLQGVMIFTGFAFAWIYERRGNLLAPIVAHVVFNAIGVVLIFAAR